MLGFYFDHHVELAIADGLRRRDVSVTVAFQDGYATEGDEELLHRSVELGLVLVTYDYGFLAIAGRWHAEGRHFPGIVFGFKCRVEIRTAIRYLEDVAKKAPPETMANSIAYMPARFPN